jgi:hypothetical protein
LSSSEVGELKLKLDQRMVGAGDVAGAAGARAHAAGRLLHGFHDLGILPHAEIVVGAPDGDFFGSAIRPPDGAREGACNALYIRKDAIAPFSVDLVDRFLKKPLIVHYALPVCGE